jgi:hypothetical protein
MKFYLVVRESKSPLEDDMPIRTFVTEEAAYRCLERMREKSKKSKFFIRILENV